MNRFIAIGLGSNVPDSTKILSDACQWLSSLCEGMRYSSIYTTPGIGGYSKGMTYTNAVAVGNTDRSAEEMIQLLKGYEESHGRVRGSRVVTIDLDLVIYGDIILRPGDFEQEYFKKGYRQIIG